jgi:prolyl-tRNA editing enzyme YbaK/EbsC (Cys-tRNA(Pro) deacylase)
LGIDDVIDPKLRYGSQSPHPLDKAAEGTRSDTLVCRSNTVHAYSNEVHRAFELPEHRIVKAVSVRRKRDRKVGALRRKAAQIREAAISCWFAPAESDSETSTFVELD